MAERKPGAASRRTTTKGGRTTPKGGHAPVGRPSSATESGRYTPPIPREDKVSPMWVPVLMFTLLTIGVLVIVLNYVNLLPGDASNGYLLLGLLFITGGFVTATNYH
ncbi:MAG: hypothetical protein JWO68_245 [Actinomycetia bacterium]|nr:hypothetical protein [Actinomycetes bacterium]